MYGEQDVCRTGSFTKGRMQLHMGKDGCWRHRNGSSRDWQNQKEVGQKGGRDVEQDAGDKVSRTGGKQERKEAGQEGSRRGRKQDRREVGPGVCRTGQERLLLLQWL